MGQEMPTLKAAMPSSRLSRRTIGFVNAAHALDHFVLLIYPTAVLAIAADRGLPYAGLIGLSTGAFVAFGLFSLPVGWLADRVGRRNLLGVFFIGVGVTCLLLAGAHSRWQFAAGLALLGLFASIYHPVGSAMLVSHADRLGRALGLNGVCGNMGAAFAAMVSAALAALAGWQAAFLVPGAVALIVGTAFLLLVPGDGDTVRKARQETAALNPVARPAATAIAYGVAIIAGGFTFNMTTIALPKLIDAQFGAQLPLALVGALGTLVLVVGALTQVVMGRLIDRLPLPTLFIGLSLLQPLGLGLAAATSGGLLLLGLAAALAAIYGQVVLNDAMIARYVPPRYRSRAFGLRYFVGYTSSGAAVPLIAMAYDSSGPRAVLLVAVVFACGVVAGAVLFMLASARPKPHSAVAPAE